MFAGLTLAVGGCAVTDPMIRPTDGSGKGRPTTPSMPAEQQASVIAEDTIKGSFEAAASSAARLKAPEGTTAWAQACRDMHGAHVERLLNRDPLLPGEAYEYTPPNPYPTTAPTTWDEMAQHLGVVRTSALDRHSTHALASAGRDQPLALLHASLAAACAGPLTGPAPVAASGAPTVFAPATRAALAPIVLTRVWALIYALEVGIARVPTSNDARAKGLTRLDEAKQLRDDLLAWPELASPPAQHSSYDLGGPVDAVADILAAWARHELALLGAWGRLMSASTGEQASAALKHMLDQATRVRAWGAGLPYWPGWV